MTAPAPQPAEAPFAALGSTAELRARAEVLLYEEARLLDEWRLDAWLELFEPGARYEVPPAGWDDTADSKRVLFYIADDWSRLQHRVGRLKKETAHSEFPRSHCVRSISNVLVTGVDGDLVEVRSVFVTYRSKGEVTDCYMGHHRHRLRVTADALNIVHKRSSLDMVNLRPQGKVSIIL